MTAIAGQAPVGVVGAGTMGLGIAQVAAAAGHPVRLFDARDGAAEEAVKAAADSLARAVAKGRMEGTKRAALLARLNPASSLDELASASLVVEAIVEDLEIKRRLFADLEDRLATDAILASNTSSLSITALGRDLARPERLVGLHFFNPAPLMALVEVVSGLATDPAVAEIAFETAKAWGKTPVHARSTPGFIVNRVARPYYGEALRLLAEGVADAATLDAAYTEAGGFRMGPLRLTDLIGQDVNHAVTRSIFEAFHGDPRFAPSLIQQELVDAGRLGRKSGRGFYDYAEGTVDPAPATAEPAPPPARVVIEGDLGVAAPLATLIEQAGLPCGRTAGDGRIILDDAVLRLSDGRTATERAAAEGGDMVLFDLSADYAAATRMVIAGAEGIPPTAMRAATGLFQALGKVVTVIDDTPGLIVLRTVAMLANLAADAVDMGVATAADIDTAMQMGVSYPIGPLAWADRIGSGHILGVLDNLTRLYGEDRYRAAPLLRRRVQAGRPLRD